MSEFTFLFVKLEIKDLQQKTVCLICISIINNMAFITKGCITSIKLEKSLEMKESVCSVTNNV